MSADSQVVKVVLMTLKTAHFFFVCLLYHKHFTMTREVLISRYFICSVFTLFSRFTVKKLIVPVWTEGTQLLLFFINKGFTVCHKRMCPTCGEREVRVLTRQTEVTSEAWLLLKHALCVLFNLPPRGQTILSCHKYECHIPSLKIRRDRKEIVNDREGTGDEKARGTELCKNKEIAYEV